MRTILFITAFLICTVGSTFHLFAGELKVLKELVWGQDPSDDAYVLDASSFSYIPRGSRALEARRIYWCGTPIVQYESVHGNMIKERRLLERAKALQAAYAPEEVARGPYITDAACITPDCEGKVKFFALEKLEAEK